MASSAVCWTATDPTSGEENRTAECCSSCISLHGLSTCFDLYKCVCVIIRLTELCYIVVVDELSPVLLVVVWDTG